LLSLGASGSGPGEFWLPAGLAFDDKEQLLFVADSYNSRVQVFRLIGAAAAP
jgi:sugar lactone lactonase YvrE